MKDIVATLEFLECCYFKAPALKCTDACLASKSHIRFNITLVKQVLVKPLHSDPDFVITEAANSSGDARRDSGNNRFLTGLLPPLVLKQT